MKQPPERLDVGHRRPKTKEEREHYARYSWAATLVRGDVLDVACGTGYGARVLQRHARVSGVDRDEAAVRLARSRASGTFLVAELPPIPFNPDSFDFVVCFETIEHVSDDHHFMLEIGRVLRPGGHVLISTPNADVSAPNGVPMNPWHVREYTLASLTDLLWNGGFEVQHTYVQSFPPRIARGHRIAWRLHGLSSSRRAFGRKAAHVLLGDVGVRPPARDERPPGFWIVNAVLRS